MEFLICSLESSALYEFYGHIGIELLNFESLFNISSYLIKRGVVVCYSKNDLLAYSETQKYLKIEKNWKEIVNHGELVLLEVPGFEYFNEKIYECEIDNGSFPDFELKEAEK